VISGENLFRQRNGQLRPQERRGISKGRSVLAHPCVGTSEGSGLVGREGLSWN